MRSARRGDDAGGQEPAGARRTGLRHSLSRCRTGANRSRLPAAPTGVLPLRRRLFAIMILICNARMIFGAARLGNRAGLPHLRRAARGKALHGADPAHRQRGIVRSDGFIRPCLFLLVLPKNTGYI
ncbi:MAG: hypothetical protein E5299_02376 [Burkholderia gladioli]|nr:MAG: hypothetical protein E5299_02376 [Burkholderia gladioli]